MILETTHCLHCDTDIPVQFNHWFMYFLIIFVIVTLREWNEVLES